MNIRGLFLITLQTDYSIKNQRQVNSRIVSGTLRAVYNHTQSPGGRILNVLDLPLVAGIPPPSTIASHLPAWRDTTSNNTFEKGVEIYDTEHTSWALVATTDAFHKWHLDAEGFATWIEVVSGCKWWTVAVAPSHDDMARLDQFDSPFSLELGKREWRYESVLLPAGARL